MAGERSDLIGQKIAELAKRANQASRGLGTLTGEDLLEFAAEIKRLEGKPAGLAGSREQGAEELLAQTWSHLNDLVQETREELPGSPILDFCRALADKIPYHIPLEKQEQARQAVSSSDPDTVRTGREVLILFSLGTILNTLEPFLPHSEEGDNEVVQAAFESAMGRFNRLVSKVPIHIQVHQAVTHGVARWIAREKRVPVRWVIDGKDRIVVPAVDEIFRQHPYGLNKNEIDAFAQAISSQTGIGKKSVSSYLRRRNSLIGGGEPTAGVDRAEDRLMPVSLAEDVGEVLAALPGRMRRVIALRFGLEDGKARTLEEVGNEFGVTRERIRQIEAKALKMLRHPGRSRRLRDYY